MLDHDVEFTFTPPKEVEVKDYPHTLEYIKKNSGVYINKPDGNSDEHFYFVSFGSNMVLFCSGESLEPTAFPEWKSTKFRLTNHNVEVKLT